MIDISLIDGLLCCLTIVKVTIEIDYLLIRKCHITMQDTGILRAKRFPLKVTFPWTDTRDQHHWLSENGILEHMFSII